MNNIVRFYAVVVDGQVVGSRSSLRQYTHAVVHQGAAGYFATFHSSLELAQKATSFFGGRGRVVETIETPRRMAVGEPFTGIDQARDVAEAV